MRHRYTLDENQYPDLKSQILQWCSLLPFSALYDSNSRPERYSQFDWIAALGASRIISPDKDHFSALDKAITSNDWLFGHLSYDLRTEIEDIPCTHQDLLGFEKMLFYVPQTVIYRKRDEIWVESLEHSSAENFVKNLPETEPHSKITEVALEAQTSREEYLQKISALKKELQFGNIYEINYCIEFAQQVDEFNPVPVYDRLNRSADKPFSAFYKNENSYLMCASPERYLQKQGDTIISQPIKGTVKRSSDPVEDEQLKEQLRHNEKEQSENVMITDLVRNDLSRTSKVGTVKVEELFGIYTFNTVHQMISTVSSQLKPGCTIGELIQTTFPMGSMTGAPKVRAMKLIESHENFARNLYSGAVGYITPQGDFDFNVVIRSLFYNAKTHYLSARVGSAITIHCEAEKEYEECLLKADNLFATLRA